MLSRFSSLTVCLDMYGCPNRCRHCWLGHAPNGDLCPDDLVSVAEAFRPYTERLTVYDWYREPDFRDNYKDLWNLCDTLSDTPCKHFELLSVPRAVRDPDYLPWLLERSVRYAQLTLFGGREMTDRYTGRPHAYDDILHSAELLLENGIAPRFQVFVNRENLRDLGAVETLIRKRDYAARCKTIGADFSVFVHQGSCDGANEALYGIRITDEDLARIPPFLAEHTLAYFGKTSLSDVFGQPESVWYRELSEDTGTQDPVSDTPVFYVNSRFDVYPNISAPEPIWRLGNLRSDGAAAILDAYRSNRTPGQYTLAAVPRNQLVRTCGTPDSHRLFTRGDCIGYYVNRFARTLINA